MKVAYVQFSPRLRDPEYNRGYMAKALAEIRADLVVFPELSNSGYNFSDAADLRQSAEEPADGPTVRMWRQAAHQRGMAVVGGLAERSGDLFFNSAVMVCPDGATHVYRKILLFWTEVRFFAPGDAPPRVHAVKGVRIGVMICFDWAFPETARIMALEGAQVICHPSNIVTDLAQRGMVIRSIENRVFTITANRTGEEDGQAGPLRFRGQSQIINPAGEVVVSSNAHAEEWRVAEIDPRQADDKRLAGLSDLFAARRPDLYTKLASSA